MKTYYQCRKCGIKYYNNYQTKCCNMLTVLKLEDEE